MPEDLTTLPLTGTQILQRMAGQPGSRQHIDGPRADRFAWENLVQQSPAITELLEQHPQWPTWPALLQDAFQTFYKMDPHLRPLELTDPAVQGNRPYLEHLLDEPATATTRTQTVLDDLAAAVATLTTARVLADQIAQHPDLDQAMQSQQPPPSTAQGPLNKAVRQATQAGGEAAAEAQQALLNWGMDGPSLQTLGIGDRLALLDQLRTDRFRHIGDLIGRLRHLARGRQQSALRHARDELHSITQGNALSRLLPAEAVLLRHPLRRRDFYRRFLEGQLQEYELRPIPREGRGPILCAIDASGSMSGPSMEWAAAVALGLLDTARRQHRDFAAVYFTTTLGAQFFAPKGILSASELVALATQPAGGGTEFEPPLQWCLDQLHTARFKTADITFITDGQSDVSDAFLTHFLARKAADHFRVFDLLIGGHASTLVAWADRLWALGGTLDNEAAGAVFEEMMIP